MPPAPEWRWPARGGGLAMSRSNPATSRGVLAIAGGWLTTAPLSLEPTAEVTCSALAHPSDPRYGARGREGEASPLGSSPKADHDPMGVGNPSGFVRHEVTWLSVHPHHCGVGFVGPPEAIAPGAPGKSTLPRLALSLALPSHGSHAQGPAAVYALARSRRLSGKIFSAPRSAG
jgi:hypothetical protein